VQLAVRDFLTGFLVVTALAIAGAAAAEDGTGPRTGYLDAKPIAGPD